MTGLGGIERVTLRPELGSVKVCACAGSVARGLASSPACRRAATGRGAWRPRRWVSTGSGREESTGLPRPARGVSGSTKEGLRRPPARPSGAAVEDSPPRLRGRARARSAPPAVHPAVPARAIPGGTCSRRAQLLPPSSAARCRASLGRERRPTAGTSLSGGGGSAFIWARPGKEGASQRASRAGRGGAGLCLQPGRAALGPRKGACPLGVWDTGTPGSVECPGRKGPGRPRPPPSPPPHYRQGKWTPGER